MLLSSCYLAEQRAGDEKIRENRHLTDGVVNSHMTSAYIYMIYYDNQIVNQNIAGRITNLIKDVKIYENITEKVQTAHRTPLVSGSYILS